MQGKIFVKKLGVGVMEIAEFINKEKMNYCESCILFGDCGGENASVYSIYAGDNGYHITYKCSKLKAPKPLFNVMSKCDYEIFLSVSEKTKNFVNAI